MRKKKICTLIAPALDDAARAAAESQMTTVNEVYRRAIWDYMLQFWAPNPVPDAQTFEKHYKKPPPPKPQYRAPRPLRADDKFTYRKGR